MARILIVEDEENIARVLKLELEYEGYETVVFYDGKEAMDWLEENSVTIDLYLLDVMLPGMNGMAMLRRMREREIRQPVIMLTARDSVIDKVGGLDQGADDYVTKPFEIEELLARIRVQLRQSEKNTGDSTAVSPVLTFGNLQLFEAERKMLLSGNRIELTQREFDLLHFLMKEPSFVRTREQILQSVWGFDYLGDTNVVDVYIRYLRQKLDEKGSPSLIRTVRGVGYQMQEEMQ